MIAVFAVFARQLHSTCCHMKVHFHIATATMHSTRLHLNVLNVLVLLDLLEYCVRSSVAQFPTAIKEFEWRNGFYWGLSEAAENDGDTPDSVRRGSDAAAPARR